MTQRPNILLVSSDQQRADCFGHMGRRIKTPHLDHFATQGTRFQNAITPTVVCQPARASILTGQLCRTHGVHDNGIDLDPAIGERGFAGSLAAAGYQTAYFGKAHFSTFNNYAPTGTPECVASSGDYGLDWYGPYMGFNHVEMMLIGHNWFPPEAPPRGQHYERFFHADGRGAEKMAAYWKNAGDTQGAAQTWHSMLPEAWHNTPWTANRAIEWLRHGRVDDSPFCAWVSFPDPHHPFDCPEPWSRLHDPAEVDLPKHRTRDFERRPWWHEAVVTAEPAGKKEHAETRKAYSRIPPQTDAQLGEIIANTYGQLALIDHHFGRMMQVLDELGLSENTYVIYISDHGDWLGDHGLILKGPMHYDGLLKVPLMVRGPGIAPGAVNTEPVSTLDLGATFCDWAGTAPLLPQHGESLVPVLAGEATREAALNEWQLLPTRTGVALSLRTVRTRNAKLTVDLISSAGEMYDLVADPDEMQNIFDDPAHGALRTRLEALLAMRPDDITPDRVQVGMA
ncbi:MAG: sulfatase-like hydrolase/transferase [Pseudomonadota bacterium]